VLEDESARVQLSGEALPVRDLVTGVVVAVKGAAGAGGDFLVTVSLCITSQNIIPHSFYL
jgi:hypothetical protein